MASSVVCTHSFCVTAWKKTKTDQKFMFQVLKIPVFSTGLFLSLTLASRHPRHIASVLLPQQCQSKGALCVSVAIREKKTEIRKYTAQTCRFSMLASETGVHSVFRCWCGFCMLTLGNRTTNGYLQFLCLLGTTWAYLVLMTHCQQEGVVQFETTLCRNISTSVQFSTVLFVLHATVHENIDDRTGIHLFENGGKSQRHKLLTVTSQ